MLALIGVLLVCALLFLPEDWQREIHTYAWTSAHPVALYSLLLVFICFALWAGVLAWSNRFRWNELGEDEKLALRRFRDGNTVTSQFAAHDAGALQGLLDAGVVKTAKDSTAFFERSGFFYYTIRKSDLRYLRKHPEVLHGKKP
jgi:hypothetical protein